MLCFVFSALIVALDQFFKQWVVRSIELGKAGPDIIPGVLGLTRWENDGAMLNFLSGQQWLLAGIAFVASVALVMILLRYNEGFWGTIGLAAVLGGSVGNLIDRIFNEGRVIDMFRTLFINFPIFNIADIFITLGFITFLVHFIVLTFKEDDKKAVGSNSRDNSEDDIIPIDIQPIETADDTQYSPQYTQQAAAQPVQYTPAAVANPADYTPVTHITPITPVTAAPYESVAQPEYAAQPTYTAQPAYTVPPPTPPLEEDYSSLLAGYDDADVTPEISFTMESLEAELGSLDVDYDIDDLLREYGIEDDDTTV